MSRYPSAPVLDPIPAAEADAAERASFLRKTYLHLLGAVLAFTCLEFIIFQTMDVDAIVGSMTGGYSWLLVLGFFMIVNWIASAWAHSQVSAALQYAGLALTVVAWAVIFVPILYMASMMTIAGAGDIIPTAAGITLVMFSGLTAIVLITAKDFSFLRAFLMFGGLAAMVFIIGAIFFGFTLGPFFTVAMIILACGYILYDTSNALHHYQTTQHVAASLALFSSLALLFWYVLRLVMILSRE